LKDVVEAASEFFVPHPDVPDKERASQIILAQFRENMLDVNVSTLEGACDRAEEEARAGLIPNLTWERFMGRPGLVTDELLGMSIANYLGGAKEIFEFIRFDYMKPNIVAKLGATTNDAVGDSGLFIKDVHCSSARECKLNLH